MLYVVKLLILLSLFVEVCVDFLCGVYGESWNNYTLGGMRNVDCKGLVGDYEGYVCDGDWIFDIAYVFNFRICLSSLVLIKLLYIGCLNSQNPPYFPLYPLLLSARLYSRLFLPDP